MKRLLKWTLGLVVAAALIAQGFRPEKNAAGLEPGPDDLRTVHAMPAKIRSKLEVSCYDCHSNHTRYPWYAQIQPMAWWLDSHVRDGKNELNLSTFGRLSAKRQAARLDGMIDSITDRTMPLDSYTWTHRDAVFSPEELTEVVTWLENLRDEIEDGE